jgi:hypothetical protein
LPALGPCPCGPGGAARGYCPLLPARSHGRSSSCPRSASARPLADERGVGCEHARQGLALAGPRPHRDERDRLKAKVQRGLGYEVTQAGTTELAARIRDLTAKVGRQDAELAQARTQLAGLTAARDTALDEVAGLRADLRQMTRQQNALR